MRPCSRQYTISRCGQHDDSHQAHHRLARARAPSREPLWGARARSLRLHPRGESQGPYPRSRGPQAAAPPAAEPPKPSGQRGLPDTSPRAPSPLQSQDMLGSTPWALESPAVCHGEAAGPTSTLSKSPGDKCRLRPQPQGKPPGPWVLLTSCSQRPTPSNTLGLMGPWGTFSPVWPATPGVQP